MTNVVGSTGGKRKWLAGVSDFIRGYWLVSCDNSLPQRYVGCEDCNTLVDRPRALENLMVFLSASA